MQEYFFRQLFEDASKEAKESFFEMVEMISKKLDEIIGEGD